MAGGRNVLRSAVEAVLGREHVFQLAVVKEDPAAVLALLDVHTLPLDGAHPPVALGTSHAGQNRGVVACEDRQRLRLASRGTGIKGAPVDIATGERPKTGC